MDVENAVIGLQQARARYDAAVKGPRSCSSRPSDADQKKYGLGATTAYQVVQDQRDLASARQHGGAGAGQLHSHAQIAFDQAMGNTLEVNHISLDEALSGRVARPSVLPANLPAGARP